MSTGQTQREKAIRLLADRTMVRAHEFGKEGITAATLARAVREGDVRRIGRGLVLVNQGLERLIYRLANSPHRNRFVLKDGMLVSVWTYDDNRTTRDADFLGFGELSETQLVQTFAEIMAIDSEDGLVFDTAHLSAATIREDNVYGEVRLKTVVLLDNARIPITVDVGRGFVQGAAVSC